MNALLRALPCAALLGAALLLPACTGAAPFQGQIGCDDTLLHARIVGEQRSIAGLRLNLGDGWNENLTGLDVGIVNQLRRQCRGAQIGIFNEADTLTGVQAALGMNGRWESTHTGAQVALFFNLGGKEVRGLQLAVAANRGERVAGMQIGAVNTAREIGGAQVGLVYNDAERVSGAQIGLVNECTVASGVQVGLLNINRTGFVRVFPLFNFSVREPGPNPGY